MPTYSSWITFFMYIRGFYYRYPPPLSDFFEQKKTGVISSGQKVFVKVFLTIRFNGFFFNILKNNFHLWRVKNPWKSLARKQEASRPLVKKNHYLVIYKEVYYIFQTNKLEGIPKSSHTGTKWQFAPRIFCRLKN